MQLFLVFKTRFFHIEVIMDATVKIVSDTEAVVVSKTGAGTRMIVIHVTVQMVFSTATLTSHIVIKVSSRVP